MEVLAPAAKGRLEAKPITYGTLPYRRESGCLWTCVPSRRRLLQAFRCPGDVLWFASEGVYRIPSIDKPIWIHFPQFPGIRHRGSGGDSTTPPTSDLSPQVCVFESIDPDAVERRYPRLSATGLSPGPSRFETEYTCYESRDDGLLRFTAGSRASTENLYYFNLTMTSARIRCRLNVGAEPPVAQVLHLGEGDTEGVSARPTFAAWPRLILARCSGGWLS